MDLESDLLDLRVRDLFDFSNYFYDNLLGYKPEQTSLELVPEFRWGEFIELRGLNSDSFGIYLPRNQTAVIRDENPLSLFHEYFGHGLYCEQSIAGRKLVELEKGLLEEERREFEGKSFTLEDIRRFREGSGRFQRLNEFRKDNLMKYELFAIWTEYLLSRENGLMDEFERKYDFLSEEEKEVVDSVINFSEQYGDLASMYSQGMARRTTAERVTGLLEKLCRKKLDSIKFGVLFGSEKEFSDIDIYLISDEIEPFHADWIDVRVHFQRCFEEGIRNFDVRVTDPIFSGEFVFGSRDYFEEQKQILREQPITEEAIRYNFQKSENYKNLEEEDFKLCDQVKNPLSYSQTYLANALALKEGKKLFTKKDLLLYSLRASAEDDKLLQLQGGRKNAT